VLTEKLDCLFADEFQDVNPAQYGFILELARLLGGRLFVIGDPDQSIYGFRGAAAGIFERLRSDLPSTSFFALDRNFRSSSVVVRASNRLIGNENKTGPSEEREGRIHTAVFGSELAEAVFIAKTVSERIGGRDMIESARHRGSGLGLNDFGVLVRTWRQTRVIAGCLEKEGLPFRTRDGSGLVRSPEARTAVNMAKLLLSPDDRMARLFFTKGGFPFDEIFAKFSGQKERYLAGAGSFLEDLDAAADFKDRLAFDELLSVAKEHPSLAEFLDVMLYRDPSEVESGRRVVPREAVSVMTMHAAKGLEFPVVFIPGMEEGLVPYLKDSRPDPGRIGEERRLFYVAMTRARTDLYLTRSLERGRAGAPVRTRPSRFLDEAGPEFFSALRQKKIRPKNPQLELFP
jgi:superfamily I DNA/RNA helicase